MIRSLLERLLLGIVAFIAFHAGIGCRTIQHRDDNRLAQFPDPDDGERAFRRGVHDTIFHLEDRDVGSITAGPHRVLRTVHNLQQNYRP